MNSNWIDLRQEPDTGIETLRAHFRGHAYDPHWHDSYLVGVTEQGVQQFTCRRARHQSTPGKVFLLEPGELHDGDAPSPEGFTYRMLYLDPQWLERELRGFTEHAPPASPVLPTLWPATRAWQRPPRAPSSRCTSRSCAWCARRHWTSCWST